MKSNLPRYPSLYQINTRVYLRELASQLDRPATMDDIPDAELDRIAQNGFDLVWLLGAWQTGIAGRDVSLSNPQWLSEYQTQLSDFQPNDVSGSCFAICDYRINKEYGGNDAIVRIRQRLADRGIRLMLDFVPNHTALDHPWVNEHPDFYIEGTEGQLHDDPQNYVRLKTAEGERIFAYGRDPYFPGWPDTLQLNYSNPAVQDAMIAELVKIAAHCDGVRCDMAMLELPEVFEHTWGRQSEAFWPRAIAAVRKTNPAFLFMAEVYWGLEWELQQQGFDYTYDKRLYDRLVDRNAHAVREHLHASLDFQNKLARFLENHDEPRAATVFPHPVHKAAAVITFLAPGLRFFYRGQHDGKKVRLSMHLGRAPNEGVDEELANFYSLLMPLLSEPAFQEGSWQLLDCRQAWEANWTADCFLTYSWTGPSGERRLVAVNYSDHQSQCYVMLPWTDLPGSTWRFRDRMSDAVYDRDGSDLSSTGLYLDLTAWGYHIFEVDRP